MDTFNGAALPNAADIAVFYEVNVSAKLHVSMLTSFENAGEGQKSAWLSWSDILKSIKGKIMKIFNVTNKESLARVFNVVKTNLVTSKFLKSLIIGFRDNH